MTTVALRRGPRGLQIDDQTAAGIRQWCTYFDRVTFVGLEISDSEDASTSVAWNDVDEGVLGARARFLALPRAWGLRKMLRHRAAVRDILRREIPTHEHLCFTVGGMFGDWPVLGALEAIRQRRRFSAWTDRAEPLVIRERLRHASLPVRLGGRLAVPYIESTLRRIFRQSTVQLLQGRDTFDYFAASASDPYCTYDTHTQVSDEISPDALARKRDAVTGGEPLRIVYAGRAAEMKGPSDWLDVLALVRDGGVAFHATWIGDGPELAAMKEQTERAGLASHVTFTGFEDRRDVLLASIRAADLLLFCHKTPESARCLVESLVCGTPIVGYETAYPRGLVEQHGGGSFTPQHDVAALAARVIDLDRDRPGLADLIAESALSGTLYNEVAVYRQRALLMARG